jgi:phosphate transport system protein
MRVGPLVRSWVWERRRPNESDWRGAVTVETRKVQLTGSSTFTISLPKEWAVENGIEPGMTLSLCPDAGSLEVCADTGADVETTVEAGGVDASELRRTVYALYAAGFETITVRFDEDAPREKRRVVSETATQLTGVELLGAGQDEVRLRNLLDGDQLSLDRTLLQLQYDVLSMQQAAIGGLTTSGDDPVRRVQDDDTSIRRRYGVLARHAERGLVDPAMRSSLGVVRRTLLDYLTAGRELRAVADATLGLASVTVDVDTAPPWADEVADLSHAARKRVEDALGALVDPSDADAGHAVVSDASAVGNDVEAFSRRVYEEDPVELRALARSIETLRQTADCAESIGHRAVQLAHRSE